MSDETENEGQPTYPESYLLRFHRRDPTTAEGVVGTLQPLSGEPIPFRSKQELLEQLELERPATSVSQAERTEQ